MIIFFTEEEILKQLKKRFGKIDYWSVQETEDKIFITFCSKKIVYNSICQNGNIIITDVFKKGYNFYFGEKKARELNLIK